MIYYAKVNGSLLRIRLWQTERQWSITNVSHGIMVTLNGDWSQRFINDVQATSMHKRMRYPPCPVSKLSVNRVSTIFGLVSQVINQRLGRFDAYWKYWPPLWAKKNATCSLPDHENERQCSVQDCWPGIMVNQSGMWPFVAIYIVMTSLIG
jgi:hypothetical protein